MSNHESFLQTPTYISFPRAKKGDCRRLRAISPACNPASPESQRIWLSLLGQMLARAFNYDNPSSYELRAFPDGYVMHEVKKEGRRTKDSYLYGAPKGIWRSVYEFFPHAEWLFTNTTSEASCECRSCTRRPQKKITASLMKRGIVDRQMLSQANRSSQLRARHTKDKNLHQTPKSPERILPLASQTHSCRSCWYRIGELVWVILDEGSSSIPMWPGIIIATSPEVPLVCPQVVTTSSGGHKEHWDLGSSFMHDSDFYEYNCRVDLLGILGSGRYATVEETRILPFSICSALEKLEDIKSDSDSKCVHIGKDLELSLEKATTLYTEAMQVVEQLRNIWSHSTSTDESSSAPDHSGVWLGAENIVVGDIVMLRCSIRALRSILDQLLPHGPGKRMQEICKIQEYDTTYFGSSSRAVFLKINGFDFDQAQPEPSVVGEFYELVDGDHENASRAHADAKDPLFQLVFLPINVPNNQEAMVPFSMIAGRYYQGISRSRAMTAWKTLFPISVMAETPEKWGAIWKLEGLVAVDDIGDQAEDHPVAIMEYCDISRDKLLEKAKNVVRRTV